jgi:hypothetical protein
VKAEGITGIPHLSVYAPNGAKLLGMGASFKKVRVGVLAFHETVCLRVDDDWRPHSHHSKHPPS